MTPIHLATIITILIFVAVPSGCIYNNAERQARDIKACESVGAKWQYASVTKQVHCVPNRKYTYE